MSIYENYKNYGLIFLTTVVIAQAYILTSAKNEELCLPQRELSEIKVDTHLPPLPLYSSSTELRNYIQTNKIVAFTVGFKSGHAGLVSIDGNYLNPCGANTDSPCIYVAPDLENVHGYIAEHSGQDVSGWPCKSCNVGGKAHACSLSGGVGRYDCPGGVNICTGCQ